MTLPDEMTANMGIKPEDIRTKADDVGKESVTVPAGTFSCEALSHEGWFRRLLGKLQSGAFRFSERPRERRKDNAAGQDFYGCEGQNNGDSSAIQSHDDDAAAAIVHCYSRSGGVTFAIQES